jgi:hypothetical protein
MPEMYITPKGLPTNTCEPPKRSFTNYGYRFSVPWDDLEVAHNREPLSLYRFTNRKAVVIEATNEADLLFDPLIKEFHGQDRQGYESVYGSDNVQSTYSLLYACLNTTPDALYLFENKRSSIRKLYFLLLKSVVVTSDPYKIYAFKFDNCKGFQLGTASSNSRVRLICFTDDNTSTSFHLIGGSEQNWSQEEINCVIKSLKEIDSEPIN